MRNAVLLAAGTCLGGLAAAQAGDNNAERMERVRREAANPLRMIIEAGQAKGRVRAVEPGPRPRPAAEPATAAAVPAAPAPTTPVAATAAPAPTTAPAPPTPAPAPSPIVERVEALPTPVDPPAPPPATASAPADRPLAAAAADAPPAAPATQAADAPAPAQAADAPPAAQAAVAPPASPPAPAVVAAPLRLVHYVAPELSPRVLARLGRTNVVNAMLRINADGSVAEVELRGNVDRALGPLVVEALRQWRYAPLEAPREQLVELVIKPDD